MIFSISHVVFGCCFFWQVDRYDGLGPALSPNALPYGADGYDVVDSTPDPQRTKQVIAHLQQKILKLTEQIKIEQTARDDNVAEYLKLANNADKQQSARIKQVFEKKNQKSAQTIQQLQRKLENHHRRLREVEHNGIPRQPKDVFRDMHQGLKDVGAKVCTVSLRWPNLYLPHRLFLITHMAKCVSFLTAFISSFSLCFMLVSQG